MAGSAALLLALLLTEPLRGLALRHRLTDRPDARKAHAAPTPYLGGVAVATATLVSGAAAALACGLLDPALAVLLGGAAAMAVLGLADDLRPLGPGPRLCAETAAAVAVVAAGGCPEVIGGWIDEALAVAWIVFTTNAVNLLDNTDGAAASLCAISGGFLCWAALADAAGGIGVVTAALAGACLGFLAHNWHPARIFLGDAGSLFLGFTLSSAAVVLHADAGGLVGLGGVLLVTLAATVDTALVMLSRRLAGRPLLRGGTDHAAHRLRRAGLTVPQSVLVMGGFAALCCLSGALVRLGTLPPGIALGGAAVGGAALVGALIRLPAAGPLARGPAGTRPTLPGPVRSRPGARARTREAHGTTAPSPPGPSPVTPV
jgi:UDP-GlcNAc:undecaprenyl-phosphate GlcNAc-1-phosphate transferase